MDIMMITVTIKPLLILLLTFHLLFAKQLIQAENENDDQTLTTPAPPAPPPPVIICQSPIDLTVDSSWLETPVFGDFRVWHIMFSALGILIAISVLLCCLFRCRIPRTKQEIEADYTRRKITKLINAHLRKIKLEELEYDPSNLLPVLKRVEDLEENRVKKHRSFEMRRLNWRQKLKRLFSSKEMSFEDEYGDDQRGDSQLIKMTKEEMEKIEKEVESAKIDSTAFNIITDQIAILSYFESDKARKKRQKEEEKKKKKLEKERKKQEKKEKKSGKTSESKDQPESIKPKPKTVEKLMELKATELEKDVSAMKIDGESLKIKSDDKLNVVDGKLELESSATSTSTDLDHKTSVMATETEDLKKSKFSFRGTVMNLVSGLRFGSGTKSTEIKKKEPETKQPAPTSPTPLHDEVVINIGLVEKKSKTNGIDHGDSGGAISRTLPPPRAWEFENIPQIEVSKDYEQFQQLNIEGDRKGRKLLKHQKQKTASKSLTSPTIIDRNRLQIPEISVVDVNVARTTEKVVEKESKKTLKEDQKKEEKKIKKKEKEKKKTSKTKSDSLVPKDKVKQTCDPTIKIKDGTKDKFKKEDRRKDEKQLLKLKKPIKEEKIKLTGKEIKEKQKKGKSDKKKDVVVVDESKKSKKSKKRVEDSKPEKVIIEHHQPSSSKQIFSRDSSESRVLESIKEEHQDFLSSTKHAEKEVKKKSKEREKEAKEGFAKKFSEHKKQLKLLKGITKQTTATSSSDIEIPVEHVYSYVPETVPIQVHHHDDFTPPIPWQQQQPQQHYDPNLMSVLLSSPTPTPLKHQSLSPLPVEHMESVEKMMAFQPEHDLHRRLIIEKTRDVMFNVPGPSSLSIVQQQQQQAETDPIKEITATKKKKKVKLIEDSKEGKVEMKKEKETQKQKKK